MAERDGLEFNLAYIPKEFDAIPTEMFDPVYMKKLYELGYELGKSDYQWYKAPPGFESGLIRLAALGPSSPWSVCFSTPDLSPTALLAFPARKLARVTTARSSSCS